METRSQPRCGTIWPSLLLAMPLLTFLYPAHAQSLQPRAFFFSSAVPDIPTETDSVTILSSGYFPRSAKVIDSSFTRTGSQFTIRFTAVPDTQLYVRRIDRRRAVGTLPAGSYRIVTVAEHIDTLLGAFDTTRYSDTASFIVVPANATPPRVVGAYGTYGTNGGRNPLSYYYWNGDTLSFALALLNDEMPFRFVPHVSRAADTIVLTITDTTQNSHFMPAVYVAIASIAPLSPGTYPFRIDFERRSWNDPAKIPAFHRRLVRDTVEGLTLSVKRPDAAEFTIFPADTEMDNFSYAVYSPLLDTLEVLSFRPNPRCTAPDHPSLFIGDVIADNYITLEDWESYAADAWTFVEMQQSDRFSYDTINADGDHRLRITYSNTANKAVRSFIYRNLDSAVATYSGALRLQVSFIPPEVVGVKSDIRADARGPDRSSLQVQTFPASVLISLSLPATGTRGGQSAETRLTIADLRGRTIRMLAPVASEHGSVILTAVWDLRDSRGNRVPAGTYLLRLGDGRSMTQGKMVVPR